LNTEKRLAEAQWYSWPIGSAVRVPGSRETLRVTGHLMLAYRRGQQLRVRSASGLTEMRISAAVCSPVLEDNATAALLLARLWKNDAGWHVHTTDGGHVVHIDPALGEWTASTVGEAIALAALDCFQNEPPALRQTQP